jgi:glucokinase
MLVAGVDLGGTNIRCAMADQDGHVLGEKIVRTEAHAGPNQVLDRVARLVDDLADQAGARPQGIGMGLPGLLDLRKGRSRFLPNLPTQWRDIPVRDMLVDKAECPVYLLNDVRLATLGELCFGLGRSVQDMVFLALGTGIGGGVVIDGRLRLGPLGAAGELGHQTILPGGPICGCGNHGCLESLASGPSIVADGIRLLLSGQAPHLYQAVGGDLNRVTGRKMAQAACAGDDALRDSIVRIAGYLGTAVANVVVAVHPELIVFGGGVVEMGDLLFDAVRATLRARVGMFPVDDVRIERSQLGERAGVMGGIALALNRGCPQKLTA